MERLSISVKRSAIIFRAPENRFFLFPLFFFVLWTGRKNRRAEVVRVDRTKIHEGIVVGTTIYREIRARVPGTRSQCWQPPITQASLRFLPSAPPLSLFLSLVSLNRKDSVYRIDRCIHAPLVSPAILNMCSLPSFRLAIPALQLSEN